MVDIFIVRVHRSLVNVYAVSRVNLDGRPIVVVYKARANFIVVDWLWHSVEALALVVLVLIQTYVRVLSWYGLRCIYVEFLVLIIVKLVLFLWYYWCLRLRLLDYMSGDRAYPAHATRIRQLI